MVELSPRAYRMVGFIETHCRLTTGDVWSLEGWQKAFLNDVYPGEPKAERSVTRGLLSVAKKNGKTELAAAMVLGHLAGPEKVRGQRIVSVAGGSKEQAGIVFNRAAAMVRASPKLRNLIDIVEYKKILYHPQSHGTYEALATNFRSSQGELPVFWIFDELAQAKGTELYDSLDLAQASVKGGGLGLVISTHSTRPGNPMAALVNEVERGKKMGGMKHWACHVYSGDPDAENMFDIENVKKANPGLGTILNTQAVLNEIEGAKSSPSKRAAFRAYRLNLGGSNKNNLLDLVQWHRAGMELEPRAELYDRLKGKTCYAGLDLSATIDLTSLALWFPTEQVLSCVSWMPEDRVAERSEIDNVEYGEWARDGRLLLSPGPVIEPDAIIDYLVDEVVSRFNLVELRYDRWRMHHLKNRMNDKGVTINMVEFGQGYKSMGPAIDRFEHLLLSGRLQHDNDPVTNMCVLNCGVATDPTEARKPEKLSPDGRIDAAVAALMAVAEIGDAKDQPKDYAAMLPWDFYKDQLADEANA